MSDLKSLKNLTKDLNILYVEDDKNIQKTMFKYLNKFFSSVVLASDGEEGLEKYQTQDFDIVITDLSMPKMDGIDMIAKIKELNINQIILITTAHSESYYMLNAIKYGIDGYIVKPFDFEQLNNELYKISSRIKIVKENEKYKLYLQEMVDEKTKSLNKMLEFQSDNYEKTLFSMIEMIEQRDTYTAGHSKRVAAYSKKIAQEMGYSEEDCTMVYQAGILHDVGKIGTPDAVLLNPKKLNDIEYKLIQEHVTLSYKLLKNIPMFESLAEIVYSHHEHYDGSGYPRALKAEEIHPLAHIMIVADAFDAMTTNRIYKAKKSVSEALEELVSLSSKQFHPDVVKKALVALKDIEIDVNISQIPTTKLEEERFAYFYKDTLSEAFNQSYLEVILKKNSSELNYKHMSVFKIDGFSKYNKKYGWEAGDKFIGKFANILCDNIKDDLVFRVFGDDFVLMCKERNDLRNIREILDDMFKNEEINYSVKYIDLSKKKIEKISEIENI